MTSTQTPVVPPRPTKAQDTPQVPPRPIRRGIDRAHSPSRDRFAPSPLDSLLAKSPNKAAFPSGSSLLPVPANNDGGHAGSVDLPSVGQEGNEYAAVAESFSQSATGSSGSRSASPEHTRTVANDLKLHAPKPSLPASSAKEQVATVTSTDSERAASFGIGLATPNQASASLATSQANSQEPLPPTSDDGLEVDEHGIPAIGRQVPMYPNAGDVQAPTPAEVAAAAASSSAKGHQRKKSARGFSELPPDSYGLHGHGVIPSDKLERAYYSKHPELVQKEHTPHHSDRAQDNSLPSDDLNKIVYETAHRARIDPNDIAPSEQVGWQAIEESTSRPASTSPTLLKSTIKKKPEILFSAPPEDATAEADSGVIHVDDPDSSRRKSVMFTAAVEEPSELDQFDQEYENEAPILALDELAKDPAAYDHEPAVRPSLERASSSYDGLGSSSRPASRPASRPSSRPSSIFRDSHIAEESAAADADDKDEYEPLFKDDETKASTTKGLSHEEPPTPRFPSRDIWEDAPSSAHYTAEVNTPDMQTQPEGDVEGTVVRRVHDSPSHDGETPAQAFARHQEELAEKELHGAEAFAENRKPIKPTSWKPSSHGDDEHAASAGTSGVAATIASASSSIKSAPRPLVNRFPSRDVWEDVPESLQLQTVVSHPQEEEVSSPADAIKPESPQVPARPVVPSRPKSKAVEPTVPDRPTKPSVPSRPVRQHTPVPVEQPEAETDAAAASSSGSPPKAKPPVPARPFGGKIAALQATFMSDLNKKLKIGPQAPKKEEPEPSAETAEVVEKTPLVDARKGRARGPQRRAPASRPAAVEATPATGAATLTLGFSTTATVYSIDPEEGIVSVPLSVAKAVEAPAAEAPVVEAPAVEAPAVEAAPEKEVEKEAEESKADAEVEAKPATASTTEEEATTESETTKETA